MFPCINNLVMWLVERDEGQLAAGG
jgi:hypothetical protein